MKAKNRNKKNYKLKVKDIEGYKEVNKKKEIRETLFEKYIDDEDSHAPNVTGRVER